MRAKPLLRDQPITQDGTKASTEALEVIQILTRLVNTLQDRIDVQDAKFAAIAATSAPTGGATVDSQSRTAINAIIAAAT